MAKRKHTQKKSANSNRYLAALAIVALLAVVVWRLAFYTPQPDINLDTADLDRHIQHQANLQDPEPLPQQPTPAPPVDITPPQPVVDQLPESPQPEPEPLPLTPAQQLLEKAQAAMTANKYLNARENLSDAIRMGLPPEQDQLARALVNKAADHWLFSPTVYPNDEFCRYYQIQSGDMLVRIAPKAVIPDQLLMKINRITDPTKLRVGQKIKLVQGPFTLHVDRKRFLMSVYLGDLLVRTYKVGLGAPGKETPTGLWRVCLKQPNPKWVDDLTGKVYLPNDPENPLGDRWIALEGLEGDAVGRQGFGIHGTIKPEEIGKQASRGCIRLYNGDVRELYDLLVTEKCLVRVEN